MEEIESLVKKAAAADVAAEQRLAAFGEIVRRYQDMAYGCAYAILGDFHLAEDAAQEAFLAAFRGLAQLREAKAFAGWLRRIVVTQCNRMTRGKRVPTTGLAAAAGEPVISPTQLSGLSCRRRRSQRTKLANNIAAIRMASAAVKMVKMGLEWNL